MIDFPHYTAPSLTRFAQLAEEFCTLVEGASSSEAELFLHTLHGLLPRLYSSGLDLPSTEVLFLPDREGSEDDAVPNTSPDPDRPTHEAWAQLATMLGRLFGERCHYREIFDAYAPDSDEEVIGSLADDVADIYGEVVAGLRKWRRGDTGEALWAWRFSLEAHWGEHLTGALRAIFSLSAWHELGWPKPRTEDAV